MYILLNLSTVLLTLIVIVFYVYIRITKKIYNISIDFETVYTYKYMFSIMLFLSLFLLSYLLILLCYSYKIRKQTNNKFLLKLTLWYNKVNFFYKAYVLLFDFLGPKYTANLIYLAKNFIVWKKTTKIALIVFFIVLPRMIITIILFLDLYLKNLHYYFYSLNLLIMPLIFKLFVFMLKDIGPRLLPEFKNMLIFEPLNPIKFKTSEGVKEVTPLNIKFKPEYEDMTLSFFLNTFYYPMLYIQGEMDINFLPYYLKINTITLIVYLGLQAFCWIYLLSYITFNIL